MSGRLRWPLIWLGIALVPRLVYLVEQGTTSVLFFQPLLDEYELARSARQLLAGEGFGPEPLFKAPLYPLLLAAVMLVFADGWFWGIRLIQHLMGAALAAVAFDSVRSILGPGRRGRIAPHAAAFVIATYAPLIRLESRIIVDFSAVFLQSIMIWSLVRWRIEPAERSKLVWMAAAGLFASLAFLNRPTVLATFPFLVLWVAFAGGIPRVRHRKFACISCAVFVSLPVIAAGMLWVRNASAGEAMILPWQGGFNLYEANRRGTTGRFLTQRTFAASESGNPTRLIAETEFRAAIERGDVNFPEEGGYHGALDDWWKGRAITEIRDDPGAWLRLMAFKALDLTSDREIYNFEAFEIHKALSPVLRVLPVSFGWLWPLALASLASVRFISRGRRSLYMLIWIYALSLAGGISLYYTSGRLRMPLVFPVLMLSACSLAAVVEFVDARRLRTDAMRLAATIVLLVTGLVMSWGDWRNVRSESFAHAEYARLSNAAWRAGQHETALRYADDANNAEPGYAPVYQLRGQALFSLERHAEAEAAFASASRALAEDATAPFNLGVVRYYHLNDPKGAKEAFETTLKRRRDHHRAAWMLALCHIRAGEVESASAMLGGYSFDSLDADAPVELMAAFGALNCVTGNTDRLNAIRTIAEAGKKGEELAAELALAGCDL